MRAQVKGYAKLRDVAMRNRKYHWRNVARGSPEEWPEFEEAFLSDSQAIRLVNQWNAKESGVWVYWLLKGSSAEFSLAQRHGNAESSKDLSS